MTKMHFEYAAEMARTIRNPKERVAVVKFCVYLFRHFGANFDQDRFKSACEPK